MGSAAFDTRQKMHLAALTNRFEPSVLVDLAINRNRTLLELRAKTRPTFLKRAQQIAIVHDRQGRLSLPVGKRQERLAKVDDSQRD